MAFFGKMRLSKATMMMIMFALAIGMMQISMTLAQEEAENAETIAVPKGADPEHNVHIWFCAS